VFPPDAMVLLVTSLPKVLTLEDGVAVTMAHRSLIEAFERYLDTVEPTSKGGGPDRRRATALARGHRAGETTTSVPTRRNP
jgi:hypothetical protein